MLNTSDTNISILTILCIVLIFLLKLLSSRKKKRQLEKVFSIIFILLILWIFCLIIYTIDIKTEYINPIYFEYFVYIPICFIPVAFFFLALVFTKTKIKFEKKYCLLFIVPILTILLVWTNDLHHLCYDKYSINYSDTVFGPYFYIHYTYTYVLFIAALFILIRYSIKNSSLFSKQAMLILIGTLVPIITNILTMFSIIPISVYTTPITFTITAATSPIHEGTGLPAASR